MTKFTLIVVSLFCVCACTTQSAGKKHLTIDDIGKDTTSTDPTKQDTTHVVPTPPADTLDISVSEDIEKTADVTSLMKTKAYDWRKASMRQGCRNGVYVYTASFNKYSSNPAKLAARIAMLGYKDVHLSPGIDKIRDASSDLKAFIRACTEYGIDVYAIRLSNLLLLSDASRVNEDVTMIATYNQKVSKDERFKGISADLEPHIARSNNSDYSVPVTDSDGNPIYWNSSTGYYKGGPNDVLLGLTLDRMTQAATLMKSKGLTLAQTILPNWQREFNAGKLTYGSTEQFLVPCSFLVTMAYKTTAEKIWNNFAGLDVEAATRERCVSVCIKTKVNNQDSETISPRTWSNLLRVGEQLSDMGVAKSGYRGLDMFTFEGIEQMWEWTNDTN